MNSIFKFWIKSLPLVIGFLLTVASVYFMNGFISGINFSYPEIYFENAAYCLATVVCALVGVPLSAYGIKLLDEKDI